MTRTATHQELKEAVDALLDTTHLKKSVVAGAGAGKTPVFKKVLERLAVSAPETRLVMTFIGGLKKDLEKVSEEHARSYTFHGCYCALLKQGKLVRDAAGLTSKSELGNRGRRLP